MRFSQRILTRAVRNVLACAIALSPGMIACGAAQPPIHAEAQPVVTTSAVVRAGVPLASHPLVRARIVAPERARYDAQVLGAGPLAIRVELGNDGSAPLDVSDVRLTFEARRGGVVFPCNETSLARRESIVASRQSLSLQGTMDCALALPGHYDIRVSMSIAGDPFDRMDGFSLDIDHTATAPVPVPSRPGLFVVAVGNRATRPLTHDAWARGDYSALVALVNGGAASARVGAANVVFRVFKIGSPYPCIGETKTIAFPDVIAPGATSIVHMPITCAPSEVGRYDVEALVALGTGDEPISAGHIALAVTRDPLLYVPEPLPPFAPR